MHLCACRVMIISDFIKLKVKFQYIAKYAYICSFEIEKINGSIEKT